MSRPGVVPTFALLLAGLGALPLTADELDEFRARNAVRVQKLIADTRDVLMESARLERTDPAKARDMLRRVLRQIEDDVLLPERDRARLEQQVRARLRVLIARLQEQRAAAEEAARRAADRARRDERRREAENPTSDSGPTAVARKFLGTTADQVAAAEKLHRQRGRALEGAYRSVQESATPIEGPVKFSAAWKQLTENRKKLFGVKLSPEERDLLNALNSVMSVDFNGVRFREAIDYLSDKSGAAIIVDKNSLQEALVDYETPVTFKVRNVGMRTILRKILADIGLTYVIKDGTVHVVTPDRARDMMVVRAYPIDDLVTPDPLLGPIFGRAQMLQTAAALIQSIKNSIEPSSWEPDGSGTITFHEPTRSLIVRNSAEVHYMFNGIR